MTDDPLLDLDRDATPPPHDRASRVLLGLLALLIVIGGVWVLSGLSAANDSSNRANTAATRASTAAGTATRAIAAVERAQVAACASRNLSRVNENVQVREPLKAALDYLGTLIVQAADKQRTGPTRARSIRIGNAFLAYAGEVKPLAPLDCKAGQ